MFIHDNSLVFPKLERVTEESGKRHYVTPSGEHYESVTTFLGSFPNPGLDKWKKKVGAAEVQRIGGAARARGTSVHTMFENFINNDPEPTKGCINLSALDLFKQLRNILEKNITKVYGIETPLYSDTLRLAGTADLICDWNGDLAIGDFKGSNKPKKIEWIDSYFIQTAAYSIMVEELTGFVPRKLVVIIGVEDTGIPQIFEASRSAYTKKLLEMIKSKR